MESIMPLFYRGASFGHSYSKMLRAEIKEVESNCSEDTMRTKISIQKTHEGSTLTPSDAHQPYQFSEKMLLSIRLAIKDCNSRHCNGEQLHSAL